VKGRPLIAGVAALGAIGLAEASLRVDVYPFDLPVIVMLAAGAGLAQRAPVFLFRSSAVSVAFAATIATYVLYGTGVALWVNLVSAAVNAFTPKPKPLHKILFNAGTLTVSAYIAGTVFERVGGNAYVREPATTVAAVAVSALVYFAVNSVLTATIIGLNTPGRAVANIQAVWRENYSWMLVNWIATASAGAGLALSYQAIQAVGIAIFILPVVAGWSTFRAYMANSAAARRRAEELQASNERLAESNAALAAEVARLDALREDARGPIAARRTSEASTP
jgi:hypothetical protein